MRPPQISDDTYLQFNSVLQRLFHLQGRNFRPVKWEKLFWEKESVAPTNYTP